jgi:glycine cleavage system H protein
MTVKYSNEHEWIRVEGDVGTVGDQPVRPGAAGRRGVRRGAANRRKVAKGESVAVVESVKAASDIYSPVSAR